MVKWRKLPAFNPRVGMSKKQYKIAPEIKADILKRIKEDGLPVAKAAEEHGVTTTTIYKWLGGSAKGSPSWAEFSRLKRERDEYLRLIGDLTVKLSTAQKKTS
jgi:transposase-like protein